MFSFKVQCFFFFFFYASYYRIRNILIKIYQNKCTSIVFKFSVTFFISFIGVREGLYVLINYFKMLAYGLTLIHLVAIGVVNV